MKECRLAVVGSRGFASRALVFEQLAQLLDKAERDTISMTIISGGARGVDTWAKEFADSRGIPVSIHIPDWAGTGKSAGYVRNHAIWDDATCGIAFWDGESKGTEHSFKIAAAQGKALKIVTLSSETQK